jgi:hypothetical protein
MPPTVAYSAIIRTRVAGVYVRDWGTHEARVMIGLPEPGTGWTSINFGLASVSTEGTSLPSG